MSEVFSEYLARLGAGGEPPDTGSYDDVRQALRSVLVTEMRRRGLWTSPPSFLGLTGRRWSDGALDELVTDAYTFIFIHRLRGLRNQQRVRGNIRPLVVRNVRNFLTELQKKTDPLGYRLYGRLRAAVERRVEDGTLFLVRLGPVAVAPLEKLSAKRPPLGNDSVLSFARSPGEPAPRPALEDAARRLNDAFLPELLIAEGKTVPKVVEKLAFELEALRGEGVGTFRFGDLLRELKGDARRRWAEVWRHGQGALGYEHGDDGKDGGSPLPVPRVEAEEEPDWPHRQMQIQRCVEASIERERKTKARRDLRSLWVWIRSDRIAPGKRGRLPSYAELGRRLGLTRDRVRQLYEHLRPIVDACLRTAGRDESKGALDGPPARATDRGR